MTEVVGNDGGGRERWGWSGTMGGCGIFGLSAVPSVSGGLVFKHKFHFQVSADCAGSILQRV
jgi:hypothetical protein